MTGLSMQWLVGGSWHGVADPAERVADPGSEQTDDPDHDQSHEGEDDRILNKPLASFFGSE